MNKTESLPHGLQERCNVIKCCHGDGARMSREGEVSVPGGMRGLFGDSLWREDGTGRASETHICSRAWVPG